MKKKRFIFDLDGTLLTSSFYEERQFFADVFGKEAYIYNPKISEFLREYERNFSNYDIELLSIYLSQKTNLNITPEIIREWIYITGNAPGKIEPGVMETLDYLKSQDKSISVLTNWFRAAQVPRLDKSGILEYVDGVYAGDKFLKPSKEAFNAARGNFAPEECLMIGDNIVKDYAGARAHNIESVLYDKDDIQHESVVKVKRIDEIIKKY